MKRDSLRARNLSVMLRLYGSSSDSRATWVYLVGGAKLLSSYSIGHYKELLNNKTFLIIHKSYIVNIDHICTYDKKGIIVMSNNEELPVARNMKKDFLGHFNRI